MHAVTHAKKSRLLVWTSALVQIVIAGLFSSSCATRRQNMEVKQGVHDVKTRLLTLEQKLQATNSGAVPVDKRVASVSADLSSLQQELMYLKGKLDSLEVGIGIGYMPGSSPGDNSIATRMGSVENRITEIETTQREILELLTKGSAKKKSTKKLAKGPKNLTEMERFFSKRRYTSVSTAGENLVNSQKGANKRRVLFLTAESFYKLKNYGKSAFYFHSFVDLDPKKNVAHTKLRLAQSYSKLGDSDTAEIYYKEIQSEFPSSPESKTAERELAQMKAIAKK